jgi:hypothetical protein
MSVPLSWAMPCPDALVSALYTLTRDKPDGGEFFL